MEYVVHHTSSRIVDFSPGRHRVQWLLSPSEGVTPLVNLAEGPSHYCISIDPVTWQFTTCATANRASSTFVQFPQASLTILGDSIDDVRTPQWQGGRLVPQSRCRIGGCVNALHAYQCQMLTRGRWSLLLWTSCLDGHLELPARGTDRYLQLVRFCDYCSRD